MFNNSIHGVSTFYAISSNTLNVTTYIRQNIAAHKKGETYTHYIHKVHPFVRSCAHTHTQPHKKHTCTHIYTHGCTQA